MFRPVGLGEHNVDHVESSGFQHHEGFFELAVLAGPGICLLLFGLTRPLAATGSRLNPTRSSVAPPKKSGEAVKCGFMFGFVSRTRIELLMVGIL